MTGRATPTMRPETTTIESTGRNGRVFGRAFGAGRANVVSTRRMATSVPAKRLMITEARPDMARGKCWWTLTVTQLACSRMAITR